MGDGDDKTGGKFMVKSLLGWMIAAAVAIMALAGCIGIIICLVWALTTYPVCGVILLFLLGGLIFALLTGVYE